MFKILSLLLASVGLVAAPLIHADAPPPPVDPAVRAAELQKLIAGLKPQDGEIALGGGVARITLPSTLRYLSPADTGVVLTDVWGNPKSDSLGMIVPTGFDPLAEESWAVIISYEEDGYVKDDDAAKIDYAEMLAELKTDVAESSRQRQKDGYPSIELIGWAAPPHYDAAAKKLYWAKELKFGDSAEHTLNYNLRLLGRRGVLVLNVVAGMNQLPVIEAATPGILAAVNFQDGHRYVDFNEDTDKVASYGLAALVASGVAAKTGLLKGLWLALLAFKKFAIVGVIALYAGVKRLWAWFQGREKTVATVAAPGEAPPPAA